MRNSRSFQGLCPLDPHQGSALDPLGAHRPPGPQLELAMTVGHCMSCLPDNRSTPPTISHWPTQFCCTPPKNLITGPTDEPPIKNPPKNLLPAGVLLRGVLRHTVTSRMNFFILWLVVRYAKIVVLKC